MSIMLQISIPLLVTAAVLVGIAIRRKYCKPETVIVVLVLVSLGVGLLLSNPKTGAAQSNQAPGVDTARSDAASLVLAQQYITLGEYDAASDILEELDRTCADHEDVQLTRARLAMLTGDYATAISMYQVAGKAEKELDQAQLLQQADAVNSDAVVSYLSNHGYDPSEYGLKASDVSPKADAAGVRSDILDAVQAQIAQSQQTHGEDVVEAAKAASAITVDFRRSVENSGYYDAAEMKQHTDALNRLMASSEDLEANPYLREARMKGYVAQGRYRKIAQSAGTYTTDRELVVLTELLVSGMIDQQDFSEEYNNVDRKKAEELIAHCHKVLEKNKAGLSEEQYRLYYNRIEQFRNRVSDPVLYMLRYALSSSAYGSNQAMRSKLFMALAKLEYSQGNVADADGYVKDALGTSCDSDDHDYRVPMSQLVAVVQGKGDSEEVKNVSKYVDKALDHSASDGIPTDLLHIENTQDDDYDSDRYNDDTGGAYGEDPNVPEFGQDHKDFGDHMEDTVVTAEAMLNIGVINKDDFPNIHARVQIQSHKWETVEDIRQHLSVWDCGSSIIAFSLEKMEFQRARIVLLCDVSGSMYENKQALKDAIVAFASNMVEGEEVSVICFDSKIVFQSPFSSDPNVVASYAEEIDTGGNTALYKSACEVLKQFTPDINSNDVIIAMTDGQDGSNVSKADMYNELGALAASKGVTVYTMGLGSSVDVDYLKQMADVCNGSFLYAKDTDTMNTFYDFIHGQMKNQYVLSYTAKNRTLNQRKLKIALLEEMSSKEKEYFLQDVIYTDADSDSYDPYIAVDSELSLYGLATKFLYKSSSEQQIMLIGSGFDAGDDVELQLTGSVQYDLKPSYVSATSYSVTIPASIATGTYDLTVTIRGESFTLEKELTVAAYGTQKSFQFGDYHFTALNSQVNDDGDTVLSGNVTMNGWLIFKGDVTVLGDYTGTEWARIKDESGASIVYDPATSRGLAKVLSDFGIPLSVPKLGEFDIYGTPYTAREYEDFRVDKVKFLDNINVMFMRFENGSICVYPDMLRLQGLNYHYNLPFQEQLIRNLKLGKKYQADADTDVLLGATEIAMVGQVKYKDMDQGISMVSLPLVLKEFSVEADTLKNNYKLEGEVTLKTLKDSGSLLLSFGVENGRFDSFGLQVDKDGLSVPLLKTPIPVSMSKFGFELSGFSQYESDDSTLSKVLGTNIAIKFQVDVGNLRDIVPAISKVIDEDDVALATLSNCKLSLNLKEFRLAFDADVVLATVLDIGKCEIELGKFKYTNALIGYYNEEQYGLRAKLTIGSTWDTTNLAMKLQGSGELALGYPYTGIWLDGDFDFDVGWWILSKEFSVGGDALIGIYKNSSGNAQFSIIVRGTKSNGSYTGFHLYITKASGFQIAKY